MPNTLTMYKKQHETMCQHNVTPLFYHVVSKLPDAGKKYPSRHHLHPLSTPLPSPTFIVSPVEIQLPISNSVSTSYYNFYSSFHFMNS